MRLEILVLTTLIPNGAASVTAAESPGVLGSMFERIETPAAKPGQS